MRLFKGPFSRGARPLSQATEAKSKRLTLDTNVSYTRTIPPPGSVVNTVTKGGMAMGMVPIAIQALTVVDSVCGTELLLLVSEVWLVVDGDGLPRHTTDQLVAAAPALPEVT